MSKPKTDPAVLSYIESLEEALVKSRSMFAMYAQSHRAKNTEDATAKAIVNDTMVKMITDTLAGRAGRPPRLASRDTEMLGAIINTLDDGGDFPTDMLARSLLSTLRTPSVQMLIDAGMMNNYQPEYRGASPDYDHISWWHTMIDSALGEL